MNKDLINQVWDANPDRNTQDILRRICKTQEELGELAEAYLQLTSKTNYKKKTYEDVVEESVDTAIMALDVALSMSQTFHVTETFTKDYVRKMFETKIHKWITRKAGGYYDTLG